MEVRGFNLNELTQSGGFEELAYLLIQGERPGEKEKKAFGEALLRGLELETQTRFAVHAFQKERPPLVGLRSFVSRLGSLELLPQEALWAGAQILAGMAACLAGFVRLSQGQPLLSPKDSPQQDGGFVARFFFLSFGRPPKQPEERALDRALSVHAEGGLDLTTSVVRSAASAETDLVSALSAGLAIWNSPIQGEVSARVSQALGEIGTPAKAQAWLEKELGSHHRIPGFGHWVFQKEDPRARILAEELRNLSRFRNSGSELAILQELIPLVEKELHLAPNVQLYTGPLFSALGFPSPFFSSLSACGRTPGWIAHYREQRPQALA